MSAGPAIDSFVPLVTILGAASAPTLALIWAESRRQRAALAAETLLAAAVKEIAELRATVADLTHRGEAKP
jgi:hypothetical protein